jgi:carbon monoxide dehydrogenase subunit G
VLIDGQFDVAAAPADVLAHLFDARLMASCLPGCESLEQSGDDRYRAVVAVALAGVKARFDLQVEVTERLADGVWATTRGEEGGNASTLQAKSEVRLSPVAGGTHVDYRSDVAVTGRLGRFALGMMKKKAQSLGDEFAANLQQALAGAAPAQVAAAAAAPPVAAIAAPPRSWWARLVQWLRARLGHASPHHP